MWIKRKHNRNIQSKPEPPRSEAKGGVTRKEGAKRPNTPAQRYKGLKVPYIINQS